MQRSRLRRLGTFAAVSTAALLPFQVLAADAAAATGSEAAAPAAPPKVLLPHGEVFLEVHTGTLSARIQTLGAPALEVSNEVFSKPQEVRDFTELANGARWSWPAHELTIQLETVPEGFQIQFECPRPTQLPWPRLGPGAGFEGWILPHGEGRFVPEADNLWGGYLNGARFDMTQGSFVPVVGRLAKSATLAYVSLDAPQTYMGYGVQPTGIFGDLVHRFRPERKETRSRLLFARRPRGLLEPARLYREWLERTGRFVSLKEKIQKTPKAARLVGATHAYLHGGEALSPAFLDQLVAAGLDRMALTLGTLSGLDGKPEAVRKAEQLGFLLGPYDSYNSMHAPDQEGTWETAQFGAEAYEKLHIVDEDGEPRLGFRKKGRLLNPTLGQALLEGRVGPRLAELPFSAWFVDCDAFGQLYDDHHPEHDTTRAQDRDARLARLAWLSKEKGLVVGSEGGAAYAVPVLHYAHGVLTPSFGWGDEDLHDKAKGSPYFLGPWWPPEAPKRLAQPVELKPDYVPFYFDPRFRLPLYQAVFHDSLVATHHWEHASLKFSDQEETQALLEQLYNLPGLYHLTPKLLRRRGAELARRHAFFSDLHARLAHEALTGFEWLDDEHLVQRVVFGEAATLVGNFSTEAFDHEGVRYPPRSVRARLAGEQGARVFRTAGSDAGERAAIEAAAAAEEAAIEKERAEAAAREKAAAEKAAPKGPFAPPTGGIRVLGGKK